MRNLFYILILFIFSCNNNPEKRVKLTTKTIMPIEIDNYNQKMKFDKDSNYHFILKGYDLGDSRYLSYVDEKDENIKSLYKMYELKNFNSNKTFKSIKSDTIYTFPLSEQDSDKLFDKNYSDKLLHKFYLTAYYHKRYGHVIIIDSIR